MYLTIGKCVKPSQATISQFLPGFFPNNGTYSSSWIQRDLYLNCLHEHLHQKFGIHENPLNSEKNVYPTCAPKCMAIKKTN